MHPLLVLPNIEGGDVFPTEAQTIKQGQVVGVCVCAIPIQGGGKSLRKDRVGHASLSLTDLSGLTWGEEVEGDFESSYSGILFL